jgi:hypothetical protein
MHEETQKNFASPGFFYQTKASWFVVSLCPPSDCAAARAAARGVPEHFRACRLSMASYLQQRQRPL